MCIYNEAIDMKIRIKKRKLKYYCVVMFALLGSLMFHADDTSNLDFLRYRDILASLRTSNQGFLDYLINSDTTTRWTNAVLPYAYAFNFLVYFVAKFFENDYVLSWISTLIDYSIIAYIAYDWRKESKYRKREALLIILTCFSLLPFMQVNSGIRTATSACIMALALYKYLYRNKSVVSFALLSTISVLFHPFTLFPILIAIVIKVFNSKIVFFTTLVGCLFLSQIASIFQGSSIPFLRALAIKYGTYTSDQQFRAYRFCLYGVLIISAICIIYYFLFYREKLDVAMNESKGTGDTIYLFLISFCGFIIGNIGSYEIVVRNGYLLGALSPIIISMFYENSKDRNLSLIIRIMIWALVGFMTLEYIRYHYAFFI
ncbi:hypothetical protein D3Z55_07315 [Clostridiaceae bacterium]|nr:hypothetical protein [Clostridiaceae bacterium]